MRTNKELIISTGDVPDNILKYMGSITISFSALEAVVKDLVNALIGGNQETARGTTAEYTLSTASKEMLRIYSERYGRDKLYRKLEKLKTEIDKVRIRRNQITHSMWGPGLLANTVTRIKDTSKKSYGLEMTFENLSEDKLKQFLVKIEILIALIILFYRNLEEEDKI